MLKSTIFSVCLFAYTLISIDASAATLKHKISLNIKGAENTQCYIGCHYGDKDYLQDSTTVDAKGNFEFSGEDELPGGIYFIMLKNRKYFEFIIDKEQKFSMHADADNISASMKFTGSEENTLFYQYLNYATQKHTEIEKYVAQKNRAGIDTVNAQMKRYRDGFRKKHPDMFLSAVFKASDDPVIPPTPKLPNGAEDSTFPYRYYKAHYFDNIDFSEGRLVRSPVLYPRIKEYLTRLTDQNPDSLIVAADYLVAKAKANKEMFKFIVAYITSTYEASEVMGFDAVFVHMVRRYYSANQAYWVSASQMEQIQEKANQLEPILIGKHSPELVLPDTSNVMRAVDSIKARYTILYFWDYDCGFCQEETPKLVKWYDSIKGEGVEVYSVQLNETNINKWKEYIREHKLDWINVSDIFHTSNVHRQFDIVSTPIIFVLDERKKIIAKKIDLKDLNRVIKSDREKQKNK